MQSHDLPERSSAGPTKSGSKTSAYWSTPLSTAELQALESRVAPIALRQRAEDQLYFASHIATALPPNTKPIYLRRYGKSLLAGNPNVMEDAATRGIIPWVSLPDATRDGDGKSIPVSVHPLRCESTVEARDRLRAHSKANGSVSETYTELHQAGDLFEIAAATVEEGKDMNPQLKLFGKDLWDLDDAEFAESAGLKPEAVETTCDLPTITTNLRERVTNKIFPDQTTKTMKALRASSKQNSEGDSRGSSLITQG